ncbi:MAG TPA: hypothetical protein VFF84_06365 [Sphingobium sp.]|nr:hypothetical protein [Sphingobium sp.]
MNRFIDHLLLVSAGTLVFAAAALAQSSDSPPDDHADRVLGKTLFELNCASCHELSIATSERKTPGEWSATVVKMISYGAPIAEADQPLIIDYLSTNYAPVR